MSCGNEPSGWVVWHRPGSRSRFCEGRIKPRFGPLADVRRMHQPRWLVEHGSNKLESELLKDSLRGTIIGMVPGIDFREPRFMPRIFEHAARRFCCEAYAPAGLYEMEANLEIRLAWRIDQRPKTAETNE